MAKMKVNILRNPKKQKPADKKEYGKIQNQISNSIQELTFKQFAYYVGQEGYFWKTCLMEGGSKNKDFKEAYILALDFDEGLTIEAFKSKAIDLGLEPNLIYYTFSHNPENGLNKFRVIYKLNEPITDPQIRNILQLMLMKVFPEHDKNCKDVSRLWNGGKGVNHYQEQTTLNISNLVNALVTIIKAENPTNEAREIKRFCKNIGLYTINKTPGVVPGIIVTSKNTSKSDENYEVCNIYNILESTQKTSHFKEYDNYIFILDNEAYDKTTDKTRKAKVQDIKIGKIKKKKIDYEKLASKCKLFYDFLTGEKLTHNEIFHLSTNLYECEKYQQYLEQLLKEYNYNNWQNKYNTYVISINSAYIPKNCSDCKYYSDCGNPTNILNKYYTKENKAKVIEPYRGDSLDKVYSELQKDYETLKDKPINSITLVKAPTGIGKSKMLETLDLSNTIVAVSNHRLGKQLFNDLKNNNPNNDKLVYAKPLNMDNLPDDLKLKIQRLYDLGLYKEVKDLIFEEISRLNDLGKKGQAHPKYYFDLMEYIENQKDIKEADSLLFTHSRVSFGVNNSHVDTIILDEDFLRSMVVYGHCTMDDFTAMLSSILDFAKKFDYSNNKYYGDYLEVLEYFEMFNFNIMPHVGNWIDNPLKEMLISNGFRKILSSYIKENENKINTPFFKIIHAEKIKVITGLDGMHIYYVDGTNIKSLETFRIIALSATLDEEIHIPLLEKYLPNKEIYYKDYGQVELKGKIYSDCSYSFSRQGLKNQSKKANKKLEEILNKKTFKNVITFKNNDLIDISEYNKDKIAHFGACEGINGYEGQDLAVIGTPHCNSIYIEALGVLLTDKNPVSKNWKVKRVKKYGFEFDLNTYESDEDEIFTRIQLYLLYGELIQAVGRARALRFDCNIYVYSSLPIPGCTLMN